MILRRHPAHMMMLGMQKNPLQRKARRGVASPLLHKRRGDNKRCRPTRALGECTNRCRTRRRKRRRTTTTLSRCGNHHRLPRLRRLGPGSIHRCADRLPRGCRGASMYLRSFGPPAGRRHRRDIGGGVARGAPVGGGRGVAAAEAAGRPMYHEEDLLGPGRAGFERHDATSFGEASRPRPAQRNGDAQLALTAVVGTFRHITRSATAIQEVLQTIGGLDMLHLVEGPIQTGPTSKVVRLRMIDFAAVSEFLEALKAHQIRADHSEDCLWASRARPPAEAARTAPVARGVRLLRDWLASSQGRRLAPRLEVEGHYRRNEEAIYMTTNSWTTERPLVTKSPAGVWLIDHALWHAIQAPSEAEEWLAALLWARSAAGGIRRRQRPRDARRSWSKRPSGAPPPPGLGRASELEHRQPHMPHACIRAKNATS